MTSRSQPGHEAAEMVLVEIKEDFAGCASGQHLTVLSFKNSDFLFLYKCLTSTQILSAGSADPRINHSIPNPCEQAQILPPALPNRE